MRGVNLGCDERVDARRPGGFPQCRASIPETKRQIGNGSVVLVHGREGSIRRGPTATALPYGLATKSPISVGLEREHVSVVATGLDQLLVTPDFHDASIMENNNDICHSDR